MSAIYEQHCATVVRKLLLDLWPCLKTATHLRRNQRCTHPAIKPYHATTNHAPGDCVIMTSMRDHGRLPLSMQPRHLSWTISYVNLPWKYVNAGVDFYETLNHTSRKTWTTLPKQNKAKRRLNSLQFNGVLRLSSIQPASDHWQHNLACWEVGWFEFNVPFQHKYGYIRNDCVFRELTLIFRPKLSQTNHW